MTISAKTSALILPVFFLLGIGYAMVLEYWRTEGSKVPARYTEGEASGFYDPGDIRGSYSLEDIERAFEIPVKTLAAAFGVSGVENPAVFKAKELEERYGRVEGLEIGTDSLRLFVSLYLDRPFTPEEETGLPWAAYAVLKQRSLITDEENLLWAERLVRLPSAGTGGREDAVSASEQTAQIKGKTLFSELFAWGLTEEQISQAMGGHPIGPLSMPVRDYCVDQGLEFSPVKTALQTLLDQQL